jgi:hypothetical protein
MREIPNTGSVEIEAVADASTVDVAGRVVRDATRAAGIMILLVQRDTWQQIGIYRSNQSDSDGTFSLRDLPSANIWHSQWNKALPKTTMTPSRFARCCLSPSR